MLKSGKELLVAKPVRSHHCNSLIAERLRELALAIVKFMSQMVVATATRHPNLTVTVFCSAP